MQVAFLIGNGFDIRMGINSAYKAVEEHYTSLKKNGLPLQMFQSHIKENNKYWSNFELAMGDYTGQYFGTDQNIYKMCMNDFETELVAYLEAEEAKISYEECKDDISRVFTHSISNFCYELNPAFQRSVKQILSAPDNLKYRFISFNYTHILDDCLATAFEKNNVIGSHKAGGIIYQHTVDFSVLHVHGALPGPIIMGVDNPEQISNVEWRNQKRFCDSYIKPFTNERAGTSQDDVAKTIIKESSVICIFGMSIGETDKTWWKEIGKWLEANSKMLIIFAHNSDYIEKKMTYDQQFDLENEIIDRFLEVADIPEEKRSTVERKIIVKINSNLFDISLVKTTMQKSIEKKEQEQAAAEENKQLFEQYKNALASLTNSQV